MAFQKTFALDNGVTGEYWRIVSFSEDRDNGKTSIRLVCYKDKAFSDALKAKLATPGISPDYGKQKFVAQKVVVIDTYTTTTTNGVTTKAYTLPADPEQKFAVAYDKVKLDPFFINATEV